MVGMRTWAAYVAAGTGCTTLVPPGGGTGLVVTQESQLLLVSIIEVRVKTVRPLNALLRVTMVR